MATWLAIVFAALSGLGAVWSAIFAFKSEKFSSKAFDWTRGNASNEARQRYDTEIRSWMDDASRALSETVHLCESRRDGQTLRHSDAIQIRSALSAIIERGRLFFPNRNEQGYGATKTPARQGYRPQILGWLKLAHVLCWYFPAVDDLEALRAHLKDMQSCFTSDCQEELSPLKLDGTMEELRELLLTNDTFMDGSKHHPTIQKTERFIAQLAMPRAQHATKAGD